ncbi:uncharacterized protein LACBIDRAFT_331441 [Laccaria bicolor S238N-H82]|uniref:Predicted protein n=1 Tax=Laccaria bicolor (strain S238N-H82 / ATCC MYA-4686) TaxID=486041 RepID=B0DPH5_LACBS|nr:uncharacterized protein LACBIDRAFT_331441 [Laccaria bicolor S238N-H82]EDR03453.1 predicted protein [Laccaria bicolor S238N-H82]|eukprot:XP_001885909.1 predicted protein [Laccaria bicolor S238N-H82]
MGSIGELPLELRLFTNYVAATRVVTYFDVASAMMFIYDYFLTMGLEVELVWGSRWGFMKALYIVQRYIPFVDSVALCFTRTMIAGFSLSEPSFVVTAFFFRGVQSVILVLMIVPGIAAYRQGGDVALHDVIYRNGIMAYVYLFTLFLISIAVLSTINVIVVISLPESYLDMLSSYLLGFLYEKEADNDLHIFAMK